MDIYNLISFFGIFILIGVAWLLSSDRKNMNWRVIAWGLGIQIIIALFIFIVPLGVKVFLFLNNLVVKILDSASAGAKFLFGRLALAPGQVSESGESSLGFILAFQAFPTIIFFSALVSILYFLGIMPLIIRGFAYAFTKLMRISGVESLVGASNIFVGIESTLTVRPYLNQITKSEACTILSVGMATVASNVLALYVFTLKSYFPTIAGHLISASLLSAPAALLMSKIILPESEIPQTLGTHIQPHYEKEKNLFEAIINGANSGVKMIVGIVALLIAVLGLVALIDLFLGFIGTKVNTLLGFHIDWSLKGLLGYIFYPFTLILGVPPQDAGIISKIIAERAIVTEVVAYQDLTSALANNLLQHPRSAVIATYALCGFAHLASMAIFVGGVSALAPQRRGILAQVAFPAFLAATLACLMTACMAGTFFIKDSILLGSL
jgi:CNT family concentrative nucleoside transporter